MSYNFNSIYVVMVDIVNLHYIKFIYLLFIYKTIGILLLL